MAQPSATKVVRDLERIFGCRLFERLPRGMHPTERGSEVLEFARRALSDLQRFALGLDQKRRRGAGRLVLGTITGVVPDHLARTIAELKQRLPQLSVTIVEENNDELIERLLASSVDLAIGRCVDPAQQKLIRYDSLGPELLCLVARANHPAARTRELQWRALTQYPWILPPPPSPTRQILDHEFAQAGMETQLDVVESASCFTTLQLVQQSDAIAVLPESIARDHVQAGLLARLPLEIANQPQLPGFGILSRRDDPLGPAAVQFVDILRRYATPTSSLSQAPKPRSRGNRSALRTASVDHYPSGPAPLSS
jgi:DNA-binding transcriptional LysR family regulator